MSGGGVVNESISGSGRKFLSGASKVATKSFNYVTDTKNTFTVIRCLLGALLLLQQIILLLKLAGGLLI